MSIKTTTSDRVLKLSEELGVLRPRDLDGVAKPQALLSRLARKGDLYRAAHGLYMNPEAELSQHHSLVEVAARIPTGVICLISALSFHNITLQLPWSVWVAVSHKGRILGGNPPVRVVRMSPASLASGVEVHRFEGIVVRITTPAKTVADCFKYRHKIGTDIAVEALRMGWEDRAFTLDELDRQARACRVAQVMAPYMEMLTLQNC